ncbi:MAG: SGNH/GDSL hydrolase family protein [Opitutales bacterium]|nr:SGNH/GDSL hydrolase family protein [Opitutales bacterium]
MEYANLEQLHATVESLKNGAKVRIFAVHASVLRKPLIPLHAPWPRQLQERLQRSFPHASIDLHPIPLVKDFEAIASLLESMPVSSACSDLCILGPGFHDLSSFSPYQLEDRLHRLVRKLKQLRRDVILLTPPPVVRMPTNEFSFSSSNLWQAELIAAIREIAHGHAVPFIDLYALWRDSIALDNLRQRQVIDPCSGLSHYGHAIVADQIWEAFASFRNAQTVWLHSQSSELPVD